MIRSSIRLIALFTTVATSLLASPSASAYSTGRYVGATIAPQYQRETASRFRIEGKDGAGALTGVQYCPMSVNCNSVIPGSVNNVVVLELDAEREELVSEKCRGVLSSVPQLKCENGDLEVVLRVRTGHLTVKVSTEGTNGPLLDTTKGWTHFQFRGNADKYWEISPYWYDSATKSYVFPAGRYDVFASDLTRHCLPVQANPGVSFELPAGGDARVEVIYRGTQCTVQVAADIDVAGLTMSSNHGDFKCEAKGQPGVATTKSVCTGLVPFNQPLRISATVPAGLDPYFAWVGNECSKTPEDRTVCNFTPKSNYTTDIFTNIKMSTRAASITPPVAIEPTALTIARGPSSPDDVIVDKGSAVVPMLQLRATAVNGTAMLAALTVQASGNGRDDLDLTTVRLVRDANGNGRLDAGEEVLAQGHPASDDGSLRLVLASPLPIADAADLLVVADVAGEVHSASAAAIGGLGVVLAFGLIAAPAARRRGLAPAIVAIGIVVTIAAGCGGGGEDDVSAGQQPVAVDDPASQPAAPVLLTYRLDLTGFEATDAATPPAAIAADPVLVEGALVTVKQ